MKHLLRIADLDIIHGRCILVSLTKFLEQFFRRTHSGGCFWFFERITRGFSTFSGVTEMKYW